MIWRQRFFCRLFGRTKTILKKAPAFLLLVSLLLMDGSVLFTAAVANADAGDFSIFRNDSLTQSLPAGTSPVQVQWDTIVTENANIELQSGSTTIDLVDGGKYLVMYNVWAEDNQTGGQNRRSFETFLTINGSEIAYGRGDGYIRDSNNDDEFAYAAGAAIIDVSAGDDLRINIARDDANTSNSTQIRAGTNGVSIVKMSDDFDYARIQKTIRSSSIAGNTSFTAVDWNSSDEVDTGSFAFSPTSADITLIGDAGQYYLTTVNVRINQDASSNVRQNYEMRLTLDGVEVPGSIVTAYPRGNPNGNAIYNGTLVYSGLVRKSGSGNEVLNVEVRRSDTGTTPISTDIVANETAISIAALPTFANFISLTSTSSQAAPSTQAPVDFDEQIEVDSDAYSHSTSVNPSRVNFDLDGDYLFFSTVYTSRTTGGDRDPYRVEWRLDGSTTLGYGGHGSFNRGDQGSQDAFTSGSSGGLILNGITDTQYLEVTVFDEEDTSTSNIPAGGLSLQGVELTGLFTTDIEVSATGTQTVNADIPQTDVYAGGAIVIQENTTIRNLTTVNLTESGTVDGSTGLENIKLFYDTDTTLPYDCASESYSGGEAQFGATDANGFSGANGISSFTSVLSVSPTQAVCLYPVFDVTASSTDGETVEISIADPTTDLSFSITPSVSPGAEVAIPGATTLQNAELTQVHYHWLNDDGVEGAATSIEGAEDTAASGFANGTVRRLRMQVSAEGSTSSEPVQLRLEYGAKVSTCDAISSWTDVGAVGGDWDMSNSSFITDGNNSSDLAVGSGGTTNENTTHLGSNGALRDTNSQLGSLTFTSSNFLEAEFAIEPTATAPQGTSYCFRVSDAGTALRNYDVYAEGTINADIEVSTIGTQVTTIDANSTDNYIGGAFVIERTGTSRTVTDITITETGSVDATELTNVQLFYEVVADCSVASFGGGEPQFGATDVDGFSAANGSSTFTGSVAVSTGNEMCVYVEFDKAGVTGNGTMIDIEITDPTTDVVVTSSSVAPNTTVALSGSTTISSAVLTQIHYHWRNDDGNETGATSASGDTEDTVINLVPQESPRRLRIAVSNEGTVTSAATTYRLEFATKVTTCNLATGWASPDTPGGAFEMVSSPNIADGNTTNVTPFANGEVTDENTTFVGTGALRETTADSGAITLTSTEFTELEYSIQATLDSGFDTTYCFRVTNSGTPIDDYQIYPELTTRQKQDFLVQRGETVVSGTTTTLVAGVDYTAPAATSTAFVRITNFSYTGSGRNDTAVTSQQADDVTAYIEEQDDITSQFTISRPLAATNNTRVAWEIVEFIGLPGTDNEMVVRDVGDVYLAINDAFATTSPVTTGISDHDDVAVFITGYINFSGSTAFYNDGLTTADWSSTTDEAVFQRNDSDADVFVSYAVVEFTGNNWGVQRVEHQYTAAGVAEQEPIEAIPSVTKGFIHAQKRVGENLTGLDEYGHQVFLSSLGAVTFQLRSGANTPADHVSVAWVISNSQSGDGEMTVYQASGTGFTGFDLTSTSITFGGTVDTTNASIYGTHDTNGTGTAYPRAIHSFYLASSTAFEIWRNEDGQPTDYRVEIVEWPIADTGVRQNDYRFYVDNDAITPTDPWPVGASNLGENFSITAGDDPLGEAERVRIRMSLVVSNASLPASVITFKLQYGLQVTSCAAIETWTDVGAAGSGAIWRGFNGTPVDGTEVATSTPATGTLLLTDSDVAGTYEEENNSTINPYVVQVGEDVEYDWLVEHNGAAQRSDYCFRMVESDGTTLDGYNNYPTLRTSGYTPVIDNWRWYDDELSVTPAIPLANENAAPVDIANGDVFKLRSVVSEVESAPGLNLKFGLQFSQYADFSDGGEFVTSTSSCVASSTWCYAEGGGVDNAVVPSVLVTGADSCVAGVGDGCGTHNETPSDVSTFNQSANANTEFEFTLTQVNPRVSTVYYFRLYDTGAGDPVVASSSFPSLVTAGPTLVFGISGVDAGQTIAGEVTDATTTATAIPFGSMTPSVSYTAAQELSVDTNATQGYQILVYSTQDLTNVYADTIPPITSTNAAPAGWSTACTGAQTGCFGYHSTDATLFGGSSRFSPIDSYAPLTTTAEEVMHSSLPASDTEEILYRIEFGQEQPAGDYETDIVYIAVPVF